MSNIFDYFLLKNELKPSVKDYLAAGVGAELFNWSDRFIHKVEIRRSIIPVAK